MSAPAFRRLSARARHERGFVLVTGMLFLVVMTLIGLALFRGTGLMNRISANTRDKQRAFEAAQAALQYSGWWLTQPSGGGTGSTCALNSNATVATLHVCTELLSTSLTTVAALGWKDQAFSYTVPGMTVATGGGTNGSGTNTDVNYYAPPGVYIERLGLDATGAAQYFQMTAYGYGGDQNSVAVVRSTYKQTAKSTNLKTP